MRTLTLSRLATTAMIVAAPAVAQTINLESAPRLRLIEERRFGSASDPNIGFTRISGVTVDRDGNVYAFDGMPYAIKVFAPDGRFLRTIGRAGQGPGEFGTFGQIGIKGDTVWVNTIGSGGCASRIVLFRRDGTFLSLTNVPGVALLSRALDQDILFASPIDMLDDGRMIGSEGSCWANPQSRALGGSGGGARGGAAPPPVAPARASASPAQQDAKLPRVSFNLVTGAVDTIGWFVRSAGQPGPGRIQIMIEGRPQTIPPPPRDLTLALALRDGRVVIERTAAVSAGLASIGFVRTRLRGDTVSNLMLRYEPVRYSPVVLDSISAQAARSPSTRSTNPYGNPAAARAAIRAEMRFPIFQMPVMRVLAGVDGTVWIQREDRSEATILWHVIEPTGQLRGTVALPRRANPVWMSGSTLWVTDYDSDDVPWVVRYRIVQ